MTESTPKVIDQQRFEVTFGSSNQAEIFETIAKHIRATGATIENIVLFTGKERYQATVTIFA